MMVMVADDGDGYGHCGFCQKISSSGSLTWKFSSWLPSYGRSSVGRPSPGEPTAVVDFDVVAAIGLPGDDGALAGAHDAASLGFRCQRPVEIARLSLAADVVAAIAMLAWRKEVELTSRPNK